MDFGFPRTTVALLTATFAACGPTAGGGADDGGASSGQTGSTAATAGGDSTGEAGSTSEAETSGGGTTGNWPLCEPREFERFQFDVEGGFDWSDGFHSATCTVEAAGATGISFADCTDDAGGAPVASLNLVLELPENTALPITANDEVEVSYVVARGSNETAEQWYSLRDPSGEIVLAAFADYGESVVPSVEEDQEPNWLSPFSISRGVFACPVEPGCEDDDNPQRAMAVVQYEEEILDVLDGTSTELGGYRVWMDAEEPDYCEGRPATWKLHGLILSDG